MLILVLGKGLTVKIINTEKLTPKSLKPLEREWVYNGLDCCVTYEILDELIPRLGPHTTKTYEFSQELQGPVLDMRLRGIKVDMAARARAIEEYYKIRDRVESNLLRIASEGYGYSGFEWQSTACLRTLFYDICRIPEIRTKEGRPTVNRDALEKMEAYSIAQPIIAHLTELRDIKKRLEVLRTEVDTDGRIRTAYNIAGTTTGRFSSSFSEFGTGGNLQNIEEFLRQIFIADDGMKLANFDAEQGESRVVGAIEWNLFHRGEYLDACESSDLHTVVSRMCEPDMPWTGNPRMDREIADKEYYRHHSLRKLCKSIGHGTNYLGKPETLNAQYKIPIPIIAKFQPRYFKAFPGHHMWHNWVDEQIKAHGRLVSLTGRLRHFFGRRDDEKVIREAVSYDPQGSLSDIVKRGMISVWKADLSQLLMENHDSIVIQYPEEREDEIIPQVLELLKYPIKLQHGRTLMIPYGCKTGWNWGEHSEANPDGLKSYKPGDKRTRKPKVHLLDRKLR